MDSYLRHCYINGTSEAVAAVFLLLILISSLLRKWESPIKKPFCMTTAELFLLLVESGTGWTLDGVALAYGSTPSLDLVRHGLIGLDYLLYGTLDDFFFLYLIASVQVRRTLDRCYIRHVRRLFWGQLIIRRGRPKDHDQRNAFAHLQLVRPEDVKRIAENNVVALVAPLWAPYDFGKYAEKEIAFLGQDRNDVSHPTKCFRDQGGVIAFHTDFPVSPEMNIPGTIYNAVTRYSFEQGPRSLRGEEQRLTRREALLALTRGVAYMWHEEDRLGTLERGKIANLSVYDTDFMNAPLEDVAQAKLVATVVDGDVVFEA